jgi:hypothetical protein
VLHKLPELTLQARRLAGLEPARESSQDQKFHEPLRSLLGVPLRFAPQLLGQHFLNAPGTVSSAKEAKFLNEKEGQKSIREGGARPPPVNLCGGGSYRFAGGITAKRQRQFQAVIDTELGTVDIERAAAEGAMNISRDGVVAFRILRRAR